MAISTPHQETFQCVLSLVTRLVAAGLYYIYNIIITMYAMFMYGFLNKSNQMKRMAKVYIFSREIRYRIEMTE